MTTCESAGRTRSDTIEVILPCLDEEIALPAVLAALPADCRPIVVDNGSRDRTAAVAAAAGAEVIVEPKRGYGAAVHAGLRAATADIVAFLDADGSIDPAELTAMAELVRTDGADLAVGARRPVGAGAWPWHARLGNAVLARLMRRKGIPVTDLAPVRVVRRVALLDLEVTDRGFGYPLELLIRAGAAGWRIVETPIDYRPRAAGSKSKVSGSVLGTVRAVRDMSRVLR